MARSRVLLGGVAAVMVATCAAAAGPIAAGPALMTANGVSRELPANGAPLAAVVDGATAFGYELTRVTADPSQNSVLSPLGIAYAFAMARAGAGGETAAQIDRVFGFPPTALHDAFNAVTRQLATTGGPPPGGREDAALEQPIVHIANGLFAAEDLPIGQPLLATLARHYGAGVHTVDFASPATKDAIDAWVRAQTADRIKRLFDRLDPRTRLVLANAIYFKAEWATSFGRFPTQQATFTRAGGSTVRAPMMQKQEQLRYAAGAGWQAVELPYRGGQFAMWVLVPDPAVEPLLAPDLLAPDLLAAVAADLRPAFVDLTLPKWDFATDLDLLAALHQLGLTDVADFSGINPDVFLAQAVHRANITVDERGTEAAAVTGLAFPISAGPQPEVVVRADRPFAFAIVHTATRTPLFIGHVADPTEG